MATTPSCSSPSGPALLGYIEEMLLELAHLAAGGGETALATTLAVAAIQCGGRLNAAERRKGPGLADCRAAAV